MLLIKLTFLRTLDYESIRRAFEIRRLYFQVALSSITWPPPAMVAIPPNELPLSLPAQNSLPFHSPGISEERMRRLSRNRLLTANP